MAKFQVKRLKAIEDLLAEANIIRAQDVDNQSGGEEDSSMSSDEQKMVEEFDKYLDKFLDAAVDPNEFKDIEVKRGKVIIEKYLEYCKGRLDRLSQKIKDALAAGDSQTEVRELTEQQFNIAKKITMLEEIYTSLKEREDAEVRQIADDVIKKIDEIQQILAKEYMEVIQVAGKKNFELVETIEDAKVESEQETATAELVSAWTSIDTITANLNPSYQEELTRLKNETYNRVKKKIGQDKFDTIFQSAGSFGKEEADLIARIVRLNYKAFTSQKEIDTEFADIRSKVNSLKGQTKLRPAASPETIKYLSDMVDQAEAIIYRRFKDKSISLSSAKGIHYDTNVKLKLYERVSIPVTGKQIADESTVMKLRKNFQSLVDLLFGGGDDSRTKAGQAWFNVGKKVSTIYSKTLNTTAKAAGKLIKGREGEMKADALSRLFIPNTSVLDKTAKAVFEEPVGPGLSFQVPSSIGGMGDPVAPTRDSVGSGDNFNPKKKSSSKKKRILEFNDFVSQFLK